VDIPTMKGQTKPDWQDIASKDIQIGMATVKALSKDGWLLPGKIVVTLRSEAEAAAKRLNSLMMKMDRQRNRL